MRDIVVKWQKIDWLLFLGTAILLILGISIIYSLNLNIEGSDFLLFKKQVIFALAGLILYFLVASINYTVWSTYSKLLYAVFALFLLAVIFLGVTIKGTTGWLQVGGVSIQPVEFAKIALIIWLARYFSDHGSDFRYFRHILVSGIGTLIFVGLVILQPDLGSALVLLGTWIIMMLFTGIQRQHLFWLAGTFLLVVILSWFFVLADYQKARITTFLNPSSDPTHSGYNVIQSMISVGSGGLLGRGLSFGSQSGLRFLPEPGTDFIFAVIAEELGFLGVTLLLGLFGFIFYRLFKVMQKCQDNFGTYLILGIVSMLLVQIFINIGMNMGISPVTGIPLPLVSAGGSSMWAVLIALGMAQSIKVRNS